MLRYESDFISAEDAKLDADPDTDLDKDDGTRAKPQDLSDNKEIQVASKTRKWSKSISSFHRPEI
jgi:hypothetical protein